MTTEPSQLPDPTPADAASPHAPHLDSDSDIPVAALAGPRFCRACGARRDDADDECPGCTSAQARAVAIAADDNVTERPVVRSLALYFSMLGVSAVALIAASSGIQALNVELWGTIGMSLVVLGFCLPAWRTLLPVLRPSVSPLWMLASVALGIGTFAFAATVIGAATTMLEIEELSYSTSYLDGGLGWFVIFLSIAVQPAIFEELAFRGIILDSLRGVLSAAEAVVVSSLMFMILHLSPFAFPHTLLVGVVAAVLRLKTGSLLPCILLHFTHNGLAVGTEWWYGV